jgi:peptidoglycan/LPS O-acetylase OafA/YrhL
MAFLDRFRRETASLHYLPVVDGLRFVALFLVVFHMHIPHYIDAAFFGNRLITGYGRRFVVEGTTGVFLFFMISGFVLSLPFLRAAHDTKAPPVKLRHFYLRRLIRLEPPFLLLLTGLFFAYIFIKHQPAALVWPHYLASFFYLHQAIYDNFPTIMPVAWSLEIEAHFYLLAPLFFRIFRIGNAGLRILIYLSVIVLGFWLRRADWTWMPLLTRLPYFFAGILLADLWYHRRRLPLGERAGLLVGLLAFAAFYFLVPHYRGPFFYVKMALLLLFFHLALTNGVLRRLLSHKLLITIGGMCYSMYLTHFSVLTLLGALAARLPLARSPFFIVAFYIVAAATILSVTAAFFLLLEKPFMHRAALVGRKGKVKTVLPEHAGNDLSR